jgi:hypothetical protein
MENHHPTLKRIHWYILILTITFLGFVWFVFNSQYNIVDKISESDVIKEISEKSGFKTSKKGTLTLTSLEDLRRYRVGQPINLQVIANSAGSDIVGFDLLLKYDNEAFSTPTATTPVEGFTIVPSVNDTHLSITAVQNPDSNNRAIFDDDEIVRLLINPLKVGRYEISIVPTMNVESTKFVSTDSQILMPQATTFKVEVY